MAKKRPKILDVCKPEPDYKDPTKTNWNRAFEISVWPKEDGSEVADSTLDALCPLLTVNILGNRCKVFRRKSAEERAAQSDDCPI
jgi:hypothetical protein